MDLFELFIDKLIYILYLTQHNIKSLALSEAKIIALTSAYLVLHPHGVDIGNIVSYLRGTLLKSLELKSNEDLANILIKYTNLFKSEQSKWSFCGFSEETLDANAIEAY